MWVKLTCSDPTVAFHGQWPGAEGPEEILAFVRQRAMTVGLPVQLEIQGCRVWSIGPSGKVLSGRLFRSEKLPTPKSSSP